MRTYIHLMLLLFVNSIFGQYAGGDGDGFAFMVNESSEINIYNGGTEDGFAFYDYQSAELTIYNGGNEDGFASFRIDGVDILYHGGNQDGFASFRIDGVNILYHGGNQDGFALLNTYQRYIWIGAVGSGWNVSGNWNTNQIPSIRHDVIIPTGVPHWPSLNAGIFSIGNNIDNGNFLCNKMMIETGAQLTTRVNCVIRNYGVIQVKGTMFVKNISFDAFSNRVNSRLVIQNGTIVHAN